MVRGAEGDGLVARRALSPIAAVAAAALVLVSPGYGVADVETEALRVQVGRLHAGAEVKIGGAYIASRKVLPLIYERRDYRPLWTNERSVDGLLAAIAAAYDEGLDPRDYHLVELQRLVSSTAGGTPSQSATERADTDLLLTDAFVRLELHLRFGKVDPVALDATWDFLRDRAATAMTDEVSRMTAAVEAGQVAEFSPPRGRLTLRTYR